MTNFAFLKVRVGVIEASSKRLIATQRMVGQSAVKMKNVGFVATTSFWVLLPRFMST